ncbi:MAG: nuclease [Caulobacter sp.]|nr:nuclease [Caulobacter sp.]
MTFYVYMMASAPAGTLYTGSTDDLCRRVVEHRDKIMRGFTARYGVIRLVWFEPHDTRESAFRRERRIKDWNRRWKIELIERQNPHWEDLIATLEIGDNAEGFLRRMEKAPRAVATE